MEAVRALADRWGLLRLPVLSRDFYAGKVVPFSELRPKLSAVAIPQYVPKAALLEAYLFDVLRRTQAPGEVQFRDILELSVDLSYPTDILLEQVTTVLKQAKAQRLQVERHRGNTSEPRIRTAQSDFQLQVYDLAKEGHTYKVIASNLRKPLSTVKSAFLSISGAIAQIRPVGEEPSDHPVPVPNKQTITLEGFDPEEHVATCEICNKAGKVEDLCGRARAFVAY